MRFKSDLRNIRTFSKLVAALSSLEKIAWVRLDDETVRFTVIPDTGSQVWASFSMDFIFKDYALQSAEPMNTINLELPLGPLQRALKSALNGDSASIRLTKKDDGIPVLSLTIVTSVPRAGGGGGYPGQGPGPSAAPRLGAASAATLGLAVGGGDAVFPHEPLVTNLHREREKIVTQDIPVRVLHPDTVEMIMQPKVREPDVHIQLPPLLQLKAISDRFTKLAQASRAGGGGGSGGGGNAGGNSGGGSSSYSPKLELSANMHGELRLRLEADTLEVESRWSGLENPELDPAQLPCALEDHPSTRFRAAGPARWAAVRVDGRDWSRVLSVGRLDGRVIACFADAHALILYVYVPHHDDTGAEDSVVTYYVSSYSL
ncbi:Hus1-like protein [Durotheca rogersii]|uniref:Hus1-like protein n=1 Tax=Durotheca rogersii TaxID=419775 RepID=UPI00221EF4CD|nr:Hus1-like protein [Durotheca rogersii]KAI5867279.1 Hus1-like protein [Durotheca rogersii]